MGAIQAVLSLAEDESKAKIIASPRVTVLNNKMATISQGTEIQITTSATVSAPATSVLVPVLLQLQVTPQVTADGYVLLKLHLNRDTPNTTGTADTRTAETEMLVESGKTAVVGGIYTVDSTESESGWPGLRNLPLFGILFKSLSSVQKTSNELLMFISPRILNADKALFVSQDEANSESVATKGKDGGNDAIPDDMF